MILLDTHVVVWIAGTPEKLSKTALQTIQDARNQGTVLCISDTTLFELANLISRKRIGIEVSLEMFLEDTESRFSVLPVDKKVAMQSVSFPASYPKDPMDRIIGATALVHGMPLVTADERIRNAQVIETVW